MSEVKENSIVAIHFDIRLKDGSIADSSRLLKDPVKFKMHHGVFERSLEDQLIGLKPGDKKKIMLMPDEAFGTASEDSIMTFNISQFGDLKDPYEVGSIIMFDQPDGNEIPGIVREINGDDVVIDFNHPLADQVILFDVEIVDVLGEVE